VQKNLCIEFLFSDECLDLKDDEAHGLVTDQANARVLIRKKQQNVPVENIPEIADMFGDLKYFRRVTDGKKVFAENIVPTLEPQSFTGFEALFAFLVGNLEN
jgi:hypothetical protein